MQVSSCSGDYEMPVLNVALCFFFVHATVFLAVLAVLVVFSEHGSSLSGEKTQQCHYIGGRVSEL